MSLALYMDHHIDGEITRGLRGRKIDVMTAGEDGWNRALDPALLDHATALGRLLVTHDKDFLVEAALRQRAGVHFAGVVFSRPWGVHIGQMIEDLATICGVYEASEVANTVIYLPL